MGRLLFCLLSLSLICANPIFTRAGEPQVEKKIVVFGEEGKFGGWPANHGMWIWGDEILVGFSTGYS